MSTNSTIAEPGWLPCEDISSCYSWFKEQATFVCTELMLWIMILQVLVRLLDVLEEVVECVHKLVHVAVEVLGEGVLHRGAVVDVLLHLLSDQIYPLLGLTIENVHEYEIVSSGFLSFDLI